MYIDEVKIDEMNHVYDLRELLHDRYIKNSWYKINNLHTNMLIFKFLKDDGVPKQSKIPMLPKSNGILT